MGTVGGVGIGSPCGSVFTMIRRCPTFEQKLILVKLADPLQLSDWERARVSEWSTLWFGSVKQNDVVDAIGARLYGADIWAIYLQGY